MLIFVPSARFSDDESYHQGHGRAYENFGIDPKVGCLVVVRPDQYVSLISEVSDHAALSSFFDAFMLPPVNPEAKMAVSSSARDC